MSKSKKSIGSEFGLSFKNITDKENELDKFLADCKRGLLLSSGRDSIYYILSLIQRINFNRILLPSYLCSDILKPLKELGFVYKYYRVKGDLKIDKLDLENKLRQRVGALFLIHYFGFPQQDLQEIKDICQNKEVLLIEDCAQSFLSKINGKPLGSRANFFFNSFRKILPVADGSFLGINEDVEPVGVVESKLHQEYIEKRKKAMEMKKEYLQNPEQVDRYYFKQSFVEASLLLDKYKKPAPMSDFSKKLIQKFDYQKIISQRRANFLYLVKRLEKLEKAKPLFRELKEEVCPLGFPIVCEERDFLKQKLIENNIYPPTHWNLPQEINKEEFRESWQLSKNILTLPLDQRYKEEDMERIANVLEEL